MHQIAPIQDDQKLLLDVQQVIPLQEAEEYQIRIRDKTRKERAARSHSRDLTKYDLTLGDETFARLPKRRAIYFLIRHLCDTGADPEEIRAAVYWRSNTMRAVDGNLESSEFERKLAEQLVAEGKKPDTHRYFIADEELIHANDKTYAVTKMWGRQTAEAIRLILERFPDSELSCTEHPA